jgi:TetR/AcrR family transcriptional regulator, tetracycline repressor protein
MAIPEPPWKAAPRKRPARTPLSQEAIVDAAFRVLDREGSAGLSMRRVADELRTGPASLYWHVANKDALVDLVIDRVASQVSLPEPDPDRWQEQLREWLIEVRRVFDRHPGVAALTLGRIPVGPNLLRWTEWTLGLLRGAGIPDRIAAYAGDLLGLYLGATGFEAALAPTSSTGEPIQVEDAVRMVRGYYESMPADQFPNVLATLDDLFSGGPEERFELGLDVILRGLASYARPDPT